MKIDAYAKINLRLEVVGTLPNGYHALQMVNARIDLKDVLEINNSDKNIVTYSVDSLNHLENNLCLNVLNEMTSLYNIKERYNIYIKKNIPQGAGLGGGSSDVAAIINFINDHHHLNIPLDERIKLGVKYGADVPYCLINDIAYVTGIGEKIKLFNTPFKRKVLVIYPNIFISTKEVFNHLSTTSSPATFDELKGYIKNKDLDKLFYNELENSTFLLSKELKDLKEALSLYGKVTMSGSGSTMLLFLDDDTKNIKVKSRFNDYLVIEANII